MRGKPWTTGEEDFLSAWHQAANKMNPFLSYHPHPVVQDAHNRGVDIREVMLLHDCFIKDKDPLRLLDRELPDEIPWPWDGQSYAERVEEVFTWASEYYKAKNVKIDVRVSHATPEDY